MQNLSFNDEWVKSVSKDEFLQHCADNGYDWSETDLIGYWTKLNPTIAPKSNKKSEKVNADPESISNN